MILSSICSGLTPAPCGMMSPPLQLMRFLSDRYSQVEFFDSLFVKVADPVIEEYLRGHLTFDVVQEHVKVEEQKWIRKAKRFILYDDAPYRMK